MRDRVLGRYEAFDGAFVGHQRPAQSTILSAGFADHGEPFFVVSAQRFVGLFQAAERRKRVLHALPFVDCPRGSLQPDIMAVVICCRSVVPLSPEGDWVSPDMGGSSCGRRHPSSICCRFVAAT